MNYSLNKRYLCKESLKTIDFEISKGIYYKLDRIENYHVMIKSDSGYEVFYKEKGKSIVFYNFTDYFYDEKEERKQKLNRLENDNV